MQRHTPSHFPPARVLVASLPALGLTGLLGGGCKGDAGLTKFDAVPDVVITTPTDGTSVLSGAPLELRGTAADVDDAASTLVATWNVNGAAVCTGAVGADGVTVCTWTPQPGAAEIQLVVEDPEGSVGLDTVDVTGTPDEPPVVDLTAPLDDDVYPYGASVALTGTVADAEDSPAALALEWTDNGTIVSLDTPVQTSGAFEVYASFAPGDHILMLAATDSRDQMGSDTVAFTVLPADTEPSCAITSPDDGFSQVGVPATFTGVVSDAETEVSLLTVAWASDRDGAIGASVPDSGGNVSTTTNTLSAGTHQISLQVQDESGNGCTSQVRWTVGSAPEIGIDAPGDGDVVGQAEEVVFSATVSDAEDAPQDLTLEWSSDVDGTLSTAPADARGITTFTFAGLTLGAQTVTLTATDTDGLMSTVLVHFTVDGAPSAPSITLEPAVPGTDDDLTVGVEVPSVDPEGHPVTYTYAWSLDGVPSAASVSATLDHAATTRGDVWSVRVTPTDGAFEGAPGSASVTIGNTAPAIARVTLLPDPPDPADTLTCTPDTPTDADGDTVSLTYAWEVNGGSVAPNTATLTPGYFVQGDSVRCLVTPNDGIAVGATVASPPVVIGNNAPEGTTVALSPTTPATNDVVTALPSATDPDGDPLTWTYVWYVDGVVVGGATGATLAGTLHFDRDQTIEVVATPNDGYVDGASARSSAITVANTAPISTAVSLSPSGPRTDDVITATPTATDADGDPLTWTYAWIRNGTALGATGSTLNGATWFSRGDVIDVTATPDDGTDRGAPVRSAAVTVLNTAPTAPFIEVRPVEPIEGTDALSCVVTAPAADPDGDTIGYTATWDVDGASFSGSVSTTFPGDTVPIGVTVAAEEWTCTVASTDGFAAAPATADTVIILGDPVDYAHVQFPCSASVATGATFTVYGWVYEPAVTVGPGQGLGIDAEAGVGPDASDPAHDAGWTWTTATYSADKDAFYPGDVANDEYVATLTAPASPGDYDYAYRYSTDGGLSWLYADLGGDTCLLIGSTDGYEATTAGALTVY